MPTIEAEYLSIVLDAIRVCSHYRPKFGQGSGRGDGLALPDFQRLYRADPFYAWFGMDNPLMYAAHKAAGGMTSIYRQIGFGCESLFRRILMDSLGLSDTAARWSYSVPKPGGGSRTLSLDGRARLADVRDAAARKRLGDWLAASAGQLGVDRSIVASLAGAVFEVRQGYKSKDSKRQNADLANAATAYTNAYLPCVVVLSAQIDADILLRYRAAKWAVVTGTLGANDPLASTYDFMREVVGYDLAGFFRRNRRRLKAEVDGALRALLAPETT